MEEEYGPARPGAEEIPWPGRQVAAEAEREEGCEKLDRVSEEVRVNTGRKDLLVAAMRKMERDCEEARAAASQVSLCRAMLEDAQNRIAALESALDNVLQTLNLRSSDGPTTSEGVAHGSTQRRGSENNKAELTSLRPASDEPRILHRQAAAAPQKAASDATLPATTPAPRRAEDRGEIFIFDAGSVADGISSQLGVWGYRAVAIDPDPSLGINLAGRAVGTAAVNLAIPSSWGAVRRLCGQGGSTNGPLIAYAQVPDRVHAFWLGPVQLVILPLDDSDIAAIFRRGAPDARSVLAVSNDIDLMRQVRRELERINVSASVVLDYRQAVDMIPIVRPDAALVHLSPGSDASFRVLAELRSAKVPKAVPLVLVLDTVADRDDANFFSAGMARLAERGAMSSADLIRSCARCIAQVTGPAAKSPAG